MIVRLQPKQIAAMWDAIRECYMAANKVPVELEGEVAVQLELKLLTGKFECWVIFTKEEEGRHIHAIGITSIVRKTVRGFDYATVEAIYGWRQLTEELAKEAINAFGRYAKACGCRKLVIETPSKRIRELASLTGFTETATVHELML